MTSVRIFFFVLIVVFGLTTKAAEMPLMGLDRGDSLHYRHSIFVEALGPGLDGSIGYNYIFAKSGFVSYDLTFGIGAVLERSNPFTAGLITTGLSASYNRLRNLHFSAGVFGSNYFNYWGLIKHDKDCFGAWVCPPDYRLIILPKIGILYSFGRLDIELNAYKLFNWSYEGIWPSLKIKFNLL
jgi:hypothetical protein